MSRELLVAAAKRLKDLSRNEVFNPERPDLEPTKTQLEILKDEKHQVIHVVGGNRCLAEGTLVATDKGPVPIQNIRVGDTVYNEYGQPIRVLKTFENGKKPVVSLKHDSDIVKCTTNHVWLTNQGQIAVSEFNSKTEIVNIKSPGQNVQIEDLGEILNTYDIHVDSPTNLYCLSNGLVCHNSGKCIVSGTLVATPTGPVAIEDLEAGDTVYNEHGKEIKVLNKQYQGKQKILPIYENKLFKVAATTNHRWLSSDDKEIYTEDLLNSQIKIKKIKLKAPLGHIDQPHAYAIGALLGDGCRSHGRSIVISSEDNLIPDKVAQDLNANVKKQKGDNYNWLIHNESYLGQVHTGKEVYCAHYKAWIDNHAHNKVADIDVVKTWNRQSVLKFVAGLLDSDGSVYQPAPNRLVIQWGMQAKSVMEVLQYCVLALWNYDTNITVDNRDKYTNGPVHNIAITELETSKLALKELTEFVQTYRKQYKDEYENLKPKKVSYNRIREDRIREDHTWDIEVDSPTHLFCLANGMVTHNSQIGARFVTWWFNNCHPHQERPKEWGDHPLTIIVVGRVGEQLETELFNRKIKPYLVEGTYKLHRPGGVLSRITHKTNGNTISFFSHHNINEAREKLQAFTTHVLWLDEMATSSSFIAELMTRLITTNGKMMCTFTPLVRSEQVKRLVDGASGPSVKYKISMLDNPMIAEDPKKLQNIMAMYKDLSEAERKTRLYGDWYLGSQAVYEFDSDKHVALPTEYHPAVWRHILSVDPAMSGKTGVTIWGEDPRSGIWYCVLADYIQNALHPDDVVEKAEKMASTYNICMRISDPHEVWFITTAAKYKYHYTGVFKKNERKDELIKNLQSALSNNHIKITPQCSNLMDEFVGCQWSETAVKKIINSSSFHLLDTAQYFVDNKPKFIKMQPMDTLNSFEAKIRAGHKAKIAKDIAKKRKLRMRRGRKWKK